VKIGDFFLFIMPRCKKTFAQFLDKIWVSRKAKSLHSRVIAVYPACAFNISRSNKLIYAC